MYPQWEEYNSRQQRGAASGCLTMNTVNDQLRHRIMKKLSPHLLILLALTVSLVLFATGCGPL